MDLKNNYISIKTIADYCYGDMNDAEETVLEKFLAQQPEWQTTIDDFTELMFKKKMGKTELLAFLQTKKEENLKKLFPEKTNKVVELKQKKSKNISINRYVAMGYAATLFLLVGFSIFMITKTINTESKLSNLQKELQQKNSIIANINTVNDSLSYKIADLNNIIEADTFNNEIIIPEIIEEKRLIADLVIDKEIKLFDANTRSEEYDSLNFYLIENKFVKAILFIEKGLSKKFPDFCEINLNKGVVELKAYKYNKNTNKALLDSAIIHFSYTANKNKCSDKFPYPAKLYLAYCYMFKENKKQTVIILQELVATSKPENEFVIQAKELLNILLSN